MEAAFQFGFPLDAGRVLIMEMDGLEAGLDGRRRARRRDLHGERRARGAAGRDRPRSATLLWKARKQAFGAVGRLAPSNCTQDGVMPRTKLPEMLREIAGDRSTATACAIANVFHAGDGNLHPLMLFDERDPEQVKRVLAASNEILKACVGCGGSITGEHGIGVEKSDFMREMFSEHDLEVMRRVKAVFNPRDLCNPGKIFPTGKGCIETTMRKRKSVGAVRRGVGAREVGRPVAG